MAQGARWRPTSSTAIHRPNRKRSKPYCAAMFPGHPGYVELDFFGNGLPDPEHLHLEPSPYRVFESDRLLRN